MAAKAYPSSNIRNIALVGHGGSGKTSLAESILFQAGAVDRLGRVDDQTSTLDFEPEEHRRGGSVSTTLSWVDHDGVKVNILDTPGDQNFIYDSFNAMLGVDGAVIVVSAPDGVEVQTEAVYANAVQLGIPRLFFISKMDRERADFRGCIEDIRESFGVTAVAVQLPLGEEGQFKGVIDLFSRKALMFDPGGSGKCSSKPIPEEYGEAVEEAWALLVEEVASTDEELLEKYLDTMELSMDEVKTGFRKAIREGELVPVMCGSGTLGAGGLRLLDVVTWAVLPPVERGSIMCERGGEAAELNCSADQPFAAQIVHTSIDEYSGKTSIFRIFSGAIPNDGMVVNPKTGSPERLGSLYTLRGRERDTVSKPATGDIVAVAKLKNSHTGDSLSDPKHVSLLAPVDYPAPMMSYVITPSTKNDEHKLKTAVERLIEEDPTLTVSHEELTHQMVLQGMGQAHLDAAIGRMKRKYKVSVDTALPPVPYRETIKKAVSRVEGKHKKQTGGAGQFGVCFINVTPSSRGEGFEFINRIVGGSIPRQFIPSVEKGMRERMKQGPMAGYPVIDIRVELVDGKYHPVDSKDVAFQMAGSKGIRTAFEKAGGVLLEPIYDMEIVTPTENMGDIMGDITSRRGRVLGMEPKGKNTVIRAQCPLVEVQRYAPDINSMTGGKGSFTMHLANYEPVPSHLVDKIIKASPFKSQSAED